MDATVMTTITSATAANMGLARWTMQRPQITTAEKRPQCQHAGAREVPPEGSAAVEAVQEVKLAVRCSTSIQAVSRR